MKDIVSCKMIIFSDIHYLDENSKPKTNRKLTHYAIPLLNQLKNKIHSEFRPDITIHLGDMIEDTGNHDKDINNLKFIWSELEKIDSTFYSVVGNHDLRMMNSREEVEEIIGQKHSTFSIDVNGYHLIFLGTEVKNEKSIEAGGILKTQFISKKDLEWLNTDLNKNQLPCLIFTHFGLAEDQMKGNWWFEKLPERAVLANRKEVKEILQKSQNVLAVFSGHQHWTKKIIENNIEYYVLGSLTENINNDGIPDGVYFEVNLNQRQIEVIEHHIELEKK